MEKQKWYKVTFFAKMTEMDIKAMNKYFFETMDDSMNIKVCTDLSIEPDKGSVETENEPIQIIYVNDDDISLDMKTGEVMLFGNEGESFNIGDYVKLCFMDEVNEPINKYRVKGIDKTGEAVILEFISAAN